MSRQSLSILSLTFTPSGVVTKHRAIGFNGAQATVQGQKVLGVSPRDAGTGIPSDVDVIGTAVIESGGAFAVGVDLIVDNQGRAIEATGGVDTEFVFADALETSGAAGTFVEVLLRR